MWWEVEEGVCGRSIVRPVLEPSYYLDVSTECTRRIVGLCRGGGGEGGCYGV